jgi:hypothetical protein
MGTRYTDPIGQRFGRLVVTDRVRVGQPPRTRFAWMARCDCGNVTGPTMMKHLASGHTRSCGCAQRDAVKATGEANSIHGHAARVAGRSATYRVWLGMHSRCRTPGRKFYHDKGVRVCARWSKFENFLADMGERPLGLTLDRKDGSKNYSKSNCRWATWREQRMNR